MAENPHRERHRIYDWGHVAFHLMNQLTGACARRPVAVTVGGSDSGGGAGIQADLKTFAALGVHGASVVAAVTAQNPMRVAAISPVAPGMIRQQLEAIFEAFRPGAVKVGMLYSPRNIDVLAEFLHRTSKPPIVLDPVMVSTSGASLMSRSAVKSLQHRLLPLADLVTPNLAEAQVLTGCVMRTPEDLRSAARAIFGKFGCAVLVKGGHLKGLREAIDVYFDGKTELLLSAPFLRGIKTHGTGCTYSAAIAAYLSLGHDLAVAVEKGKQRITYAIAYSYRAGRFSVLNPF